MTADLITEAEPVARRSLALSPSRAADFKQCPLKYRYRAVDRLPEPKTRAQVRGTVVHAALESLYALPAEKRVMGQAEDLVEPSWANMVEANQEVAELVPEADRAEFLAGARSLVRAYYSLEDPTAFNPESCEQLVEALLPNGVPLRGFVDRIDVSPTGLLRVVDYKTGRVPAEMFESRAVFQLKFYALVLHRTRGVVPKQLRLLYLADKKVLTYEPDIAELDRFERTLTAIWSAILQAGRTGDFRANPGKLCSWCDFQVYCPAYGGEAPQYPGWPEGDSA